MIIKNSIRISEEMAESIIAFVKNYEREENPDELWDTIMYLQEAVDEF